MSCDIFIANAYAVIFNLHDIVYVVLFRYMWRRKLNINFNVSHELLKIKEDHTASVQWQSLEFSRCFTAHSVNQYSTKGNVLAWTNGWQNQKPNTKLNTSPNFGFYAIFIFFSFFFSNSMTKWVFSGPRHELFVVEYVCVGLMMLLDKLSREILVNMCSLLFCITFQSMVVSFETENINIFVN